MSQNKCKPTSVVALTISGGLPQVISDNRYVKQPFNMLIRRASLEALSSNVVSYLVRLLDSQEDHRRLINPNYGNNKSIL